MTEAEWFTVGARCIEHTNCEAAVTCSTCGTFVCERCHDEQHLCVRCSGASLQREVRRLARGIGFKLLVLPALLTVSTVLMIARRGAPADVLLTSLLPWLLPMFCGFRLILGPGPRAAWLGCLASTALLLQLVIPDLIQGIGLLRAGELTLLAAAPVSAIISTLSLTSRVERLRFLAV